ncbi:hypothetical protein Q0Z83_076570 [Actinoplanes sichuanensis]|nr:hypothetical protein Q0Z83_076570 [Actinoplanes sichuanensis]
MPSHRFLPLCIAAAALLVACDSGASETVDDRSGVTYTCCSAEDVDRPYRPGQTLLVHWTAESPAAPVTDSPQVELTARLTGPYATVDELKTAIGERGDDAGKVTFEAQPLRPTGTPGEQPVSSIPISSDARPGFYNLTTAENQAGRTASGGSIIRVIADASPQS